MKGINLSEWALKHQQMIAFLLLLLTVTGVLAYRSLGQKEDPDFTIKTMVVQAYWPGSSAQQMADQVTDKIEKKLQEVAEIDYTSTYVQPGRNADQGQPARGRRRRRRCPTSGTRCARRSATSATPCRRACRGRSSTTSSATPSATSTRSPATASAMPSCAEFADAARNEFLRVADVNKVDLVGKQDEKIYVETSTAKLASLGIDPALIATTLAQTNAVAAAGTVQTTAEQVRLTVSGEFDSVESIRDIGIRAGERTFRLGDIADVRRGFVDPAVCQDALQRQRGDRPGGQHAQGRRRDPPGRAAGRDGAAHPVEPAGRRADPRGQRPAARGRGTRCTSSRRAWPRP